MTTTPKARAQKAMEIYIKVTLPEEYIGVHPDLILQDVVANASAWQMEVCTPSPAINQELAEAMTTAAFWMANAISNEGFISPELKGKYVDALEALEKHAAAVKRGEG